MTGQRVEKKPGGGAKKIWIIAGAAVGILLCAYLGLCAWVGSSDKIFPNVSVLGVDVSGMTQSQAQAAVEEALEQEGDQISVVLRYGDWSGEITAAQMKDAWGDVADPAIQISRGSFLTQGGKYLVHLAGTQHMVQIPRSPENTAVEQLLDKLEEEAAGDPAEAQYALEGDRLVMTKGRSAVGFDRDEARKEVLSAMDEALELKFAQGQTGTVEVERDLAPQQTTPREPDFDAIHAELATQAKDAVMDPETFAVTDAVVGVDFDVQALKAAYDQAKEGETFSIPVTLTQPKETKQSLESKLFRDVLGEGSTVLSGTANRQFNVKLAAEACNGAIILPGEIFSFNGQTGSRSASMGYKTATVYSGGKTVEEVGGGVCQTSSTIYYALLHSALEVVERRNHGYNTDYVPVGMDATVYYGLTDFQFKNNTEYPIKVTIAPEQQGNKEVLVCRIYGTNDEGVYAIPESYAYDKQAPTTVYQPDESVPRGTTKVDKVQNPYTGLKAQTYRSIYDKDGNLIEKQDMGISVYKMRPKTILYNPADGDPATWVNGVPPTSSTTTDPGTTTPETGTETGSASGTGTDPVNPGSGDASSGSTDPVIPGTGDTSSGGTEPVLPSTGEETDGGSTVPDSPPSQDIGA